MTSTRPADGAPVDTPWGQEVHDQLFTPIGCVARSALISSIATTMIKLPLTVGGPHLDTGDFLVPSGADGVYWVHGVGIVGSLGSAAATRLQVYKNGAAITGIHNARWEPTGAIAGSGCSWTGMLSLVAGDRISFYTSGNSGTSGMTMTCDAFIRQVADSLA